MPCYLNQILVSARQQRLVTGDTVLPGESSQCAGISDRPSVSAAAVENRPLQAKTGCV